ncbi:hypothetical protein L7F22_022916 [Adiantum nelumboides]|nr:hypothetical protein [Adiantum nelumboides]
MFPNQTILEAIVENMKTSLRMVKGMESVDKLAAEFFMNFKDQHPSIDIGFRAFHKLKPFFVRKLKERNTCCCVYHTRIDLMRIAIDALLQNQEPTTASPSISDSAAVNTLATLQEELQIEKLQRQLLVNGFMSQTAQHEAKVKQLEEELARAKAELEAVGSLASKSHIHQAETHVPIQPPQMPEVPEFQGTEEEEQPRPAPGDLNIREQMEQEIEDMPEGPAKEYLMYEKKVMESAALAFLQPEEQIKDFGSDFLPLSLMRHEANLWKEKMRPAVPRNEDGDMRVFHSQPKKQKPS